VQDPLVKGYLHFAMGNSAFFLGELARAPDHYKQAEKIYLEKSRNIGWEYTVLKSYFGMVQCWLGSWGKMQRQWDRWTGDAKERNDLFLQTVQRIWPMGALRWLAADRPDKVWKMLSHALREAPSSNEGVINVFAAMATSYTSVYCGNYQGALYPLDEKLRAFAKTPTGRFSPHFRNIVNYRFAYGALAQALVSKDTDPILNIAERRAKMLAKDNSAMALAYVAFIRAAIAHQKGDEETATAGLRDAVRAFDKLQYKMYAAATRRQLGRILGGEEGQSLIERADVAMGEEEVVNPERIAAMLAPGFFL
jgi:tetratricopeptide (TPR) repeat protein